MEFIHEMIAGDGLPTTFIRVTPSPEGGILVCVIGTEEELLGQLHLKQNRTGYHVCLQAGGQRRLVPFIAFANEGKCLGDILPAYRDRLTGRTFGILARRELREMPVAEFLERLGQAVAHDAFRLGPTWRGSQWAETLYPVSRGIGPKTIQELATIFLHEEVWEHVFG